MRLVIALPRQLDRDLVHAVGVTANEYTAIMNLSEAPDRELRMADLASATGLSASRITRLVDDLVARGFVTKRASAVDGRGTIAKLTPKGTAKLKAAWPAHLDSVRRLVLDHLDPAGVEAAGAALDVVAARFQSRNPTSGDPS